MNSIHSLAKPFLGCLLDAYGVFWGGNGVGPLPGAKEAMQQLVDAGKIVGILSNSTQSAEKEIQKLQNHGLHQGRHFHFFITSGQIAKTLLLQEALPFATPRKRFITTTAAHPHFSSTKSLFQDTPYIETSQIEDADFLFASVPHIDGEDQTDPELFRPIISAFQHSGLPMLCVNPDCFAHEGNPARQVVRQGSLAKLYEQVGGKVYYIGKPSDRAYLSAMEEFKKFAIHSCASVLMVGDTRETDIRGAKSVSMKCCLLTQTGIMADRLHHDPKALDSLVYEEVPDFLLERLS